MSDEIDTVSSVSARCRHDLFDERPGGTVSRGRFSRTAVGGKHRDIGRGKIKYSIAIQVGLDCLAQPVALVVVTVLSFSDPLALISVTVSVLDPSALSTVTSVLAISNVPLPSISTWIASLNPWHLPL